MEGMANSSKNKGDRYERAAHAYLRENFAALLLSDSSRNLGAGRVADQGDLNVLYDTAVQSKAVSEMGKAMRDAATSAVRQSIAANLPYGMGITPIQGARAGTVRFAISTVPAHWPATLQTEPVMRFSTVSLLVKWLRDDEGPAGYLAHPRERRLAVLEGRGCEPIYVSTPECFFAGYAARAQAAGHDRLMLRGWSRVDLKGAFRWTPNRLDARRLALLHGVNEDTVTVEGVGTSSDFRLWITGDECTAGYQGAAELTAALDMAGSMEDLMRAPKRKKVAVPA